LSSTDETSQAVVAAEMQRCRALSEQDWETLDALLHEKLTHTHMNGRVDTKAALIENVKRRPRTVRRGTLTVHVFGDVAVMTGPQYLDLGAGELENQATETWIKQDGRWLLAAFHASTGDPAAK
jgi:ketosteroid isomerase-like protein